MTPLRWAAGFARFWYQFVVGDDWTIAATVGAALIAVWALLRGGVGAWWLMPPVVLGVLALSLWRARRLP